MLFGLIKHVSRCIQATTYISSAPGISSSKFQMWNGHSIIETSQTLGRVSSSTLLIGQSDLQLLWFPSVHSW